VNIHAFKIKLNTGQNKHEVSLNNEGDEDYDNNAKDLS
jgi:hypothetical protein